MPSKSERGSAVALLRELDEIGQNKQRRSGDEVVIDMIPKFAALIVALGDDLNKANRTLLWLTVAITFLTVVLLCLTAAQVYLAYLKT